MDIIQNNWTLLQTIRTRFPLHNPEHIHKKYYLTHKKK